MAPRTEYVPLDTPPALLVPSPRAASPMLTPPTSSPSFPPIRACLFDMDGLLIDSEDHYTTVTNTILAEYSRPPLPWSIKAQLQGRPGPAATKIFFGWAQLPISVDEYMAKQVVLQEKEFLKCRPLPGVEALLRRLSATARRRGGAGGEGRGNGTVEIAVATSSHSRMFGIKTAGMKDLFGLFPPTQVVKGDDARIPRGRGKPLPDIYLVALRTINDQLRDEGVAEADLITPEECLVFEDSVPGIEAGRRAGMRVVWCPHTGLLQEYRGKEKDVLAGRVGMHKEEDLEKTAPSEGLPGSPGHVGEVDDGWGELLTTLEDFNYEKYGIRIDG